MHRSWSLRILFAKYDDYIERFVRDGINQVAEAEFGKFRIFPYKAVS